MKKAAIIFLALVIGVTFMGCKSTSGEATELQKTMLGHWENGSGGEIFLSPTIVTLVAGGEKYTVAYRVTGGDKNWGKLNTKVNLEQAEKVKSEYVTFTGASDTNIMTLENGVLNPDNFLFHPMNFKYVDNKQSP